MQPEVDYPSLKSSVKGVPSDFGWALKPRRQATSMIKERIYRWLEKLEEEHIPTALRESSMSSTLIRMAHRWGYEVALPPLPRQRQYKEPQGWALSRNHSRKS